MIPIIVALFDDFGVAQRTRTQLVGEGLPTDRVELTSRLETGQADTQPGPTFRSRLDQYFHVLFDQTGDQACASAFAQRVDSGGSAITVHPRTDYEIESARRILQQNRPARVEERLQAPSDAPAAGRRSH